MKCDQCGHVNSAEANFCSSCGALTGPGDDTTVTFIPADTGGHPEANEEELTLAIPVVPHGTGILVVKRGPNAGSRFALESTVTRAGRHPESDIFLDDITVSRRHAEFASQGAGFVVRDVGSLNGTYLNRERIEQAELSSGDEVQIGKFKLVFIAGPPQVSDAG
ncbi:MAG: FHA domain-containing protein [Acidimicrobiales bacterium]